MNIVNLTPHSIVLMPCRAFIDSDTVCENCLEKSAQISLNALSGIYWFGQKIEEDKKIREEGLNALSGIYWFGQNPLFVRKVLLPYVLMPCRAFIDSDFIREWVLIFLPISLNALSGIYWFGQKKMGANFFELDGLNALSGIYWFGQCWSRNFVWPSHTRLNALSGIYWFGQTPQIPPEQWFSNGLNALSGIYWFGRNCCPSQSLGGGVS